MTGDPIMCKRCGVILSQKSLLKELSPSEARRLTTATALGPTFTPAPPIHIRYQGGSWVRKPMAPEDPNVVAESISSFWCCEFCGAANAIDVEEAREIMSEPCVDYLVQPAPHVNEAEKGSMLIFVIDISGSMCVTSEVGT